MEVAAAKTEQVVPAGQRSQSTGIVVKRNATASGNVTVSSAATETALFVSFPAIVIASYDDDPFLTESASVIAFWNVSASGLDVSWGAIGIVNGVESLSVDIAEARANVLLSFQQLPVCES